MMNMIWAAMLFAGLLWGMVRGRSAEMTQAAMAAAREAVQLSLSMAGGFALFSGMLAIVEKSGAIRAGTRLMSPLLRRLFKGVPPGSEAQQAIAANIAANMLGLGNAATPMGLRAMRLLSAEEEGLSRATDAMCMFLVVNAASLQLFPATVIAMRAAAGSAAPAAIFLPTLITTGATATVGILSCALLARLGRRRDA